MYDKFKRKQWNLTKKKVKRIIGNFHVFGENFEVDYQMNLQFKNIVAIGCLARYFNKLAEMVQFTTVQRWLQFRSLNFGPPNVLRHNVFQLSTR